MQVEIEETGTVSSTAFHTNPSSEFLISEGAQLNNNTNDDDDFDNETGREMNSNEFIVPSVTLIKPEMHNKNNETEIQRLRENNVRTENSRAPLVLSPTDITMVESLYFNHQILGQTAKVNLTRSLGHCIRKKNSFSYSVFSSSGGSIEEETELVYATLQKFDTLTMDYNPMKDNVEVLVASDGFWDMVADDEIHSLLNEMECAWRRKQIANETTEGRETLNQQEGLTGIENDVQEEEIILKEDEMENGAHTLDKFALKGRENSSMEGIKVRGGIDKYKADASELESDKRIEDFYVQFANDRWKQMWNYQYKNFPPQVTKFEEGDDIGVAVFSSYVIQKPN